MILRKIALALMTIGALNWGLVGFFRFDLVAWICMGSDTVAARIIYALVGLAGIVGIVMLFTSEQQCECKPEECR